MENRKEKGVSLKKREPKVICESPSESGEEESEISAEGDNKMMDVDMEFDLKDAHMMFIDSVSMMMNIYGQGVIKDIFNLCTKILSDEWLTSCATMVGDETEGTGENLSMTCYGFATMVNLTAYPKERFTTELMTFLKEKYGKEKADTYKDICDTQQKALLIREKYYNLPDDVTDALLVQIKEDYKWVEENEDDDEVPSYRFKKLLYILRCKKHVSKDAPVKKVKTEGGSMSRGPAGTFMYYDEFEEQIVLSSQDVVHFDLNIEPHNETEDYHVYNSRAVIWIDTKQFFRLVDTLLDGNKK